VVPAVATEWADVEVVPVAAIELAPVPVVVQPAAAEPSKFVMPYAAFPRSFPTAALVCELDRS